MLTKYEQEQAELNAKLDELRPMLAETLEQTQNADRFLRLVRRITEIDTLTAEIVSEFIEKIVVSETVIVTPRRFSHWKDEKRQEILIVYNYIGAMPMLETAEATTIETREKIISAT